MSIASFSVKQPVLVNLLSIFSLIMGGMVLKDMTRESIPAVPTGWCQVITLVPGASAEEVEQLVTVPLETAAGGVDNIDQMFSTSREGLSSIFIQFEPTVEDVGRAVIEVSNQTGRVELPDLAEEPIVREFKVTVPTLALAIRGDVPERVLQRMIRFRRFYGLCQSGGITGSRAAHLAGYYDQSHAERDFRAFTGTAPIHHFRDTPGMTAALLSHSS